MRLFATKKELIIAICVLMAIFLINCSLKYYKYKDFTSQPRQQISGQVIQQYPKTRGNFTYQVLKVRAADFDFYTTSRKNDETFYHITIAANTTKVTFLKYLSGTIYLPNFSLKNAASDSAKPPNRRLSSHLSELIKSQHTDPKIAQLYSALYLATPINKELRANVTNWGIAHIIAISGFHLSLLMGLSFLLLRPAIAPLQGRYFPYINVPFYLTAAVLAVMGGYLWVLDFTPSFLRAYLMGVLGFLLLARGLKLFSFGVLIFCVLLAVALWPGLLFSVGFYFSVMGVFFIFLYIRHFGKAGDLKSPLKMAAHTLFLELFVFSAMNIPVFYFFSAASLYQLSVIPLAYVFVVFYPVSIVLHLSGAGGLFDGHLLEFLEYAPQQAEIIVPLWGFIAFNIAALMAIKWRYIAILLAITGMAVFLGGIYFYE